MEHISPPDDTIESPPPSAGDSAQQYIQRQRHKRWMTQVGLSLLWGCVLALANAWFIGANPWLVVSLGYVSMVAGLLATRIRFSSRRDTLPEIVSDDLGLLEQCFAILQKQVTVTIKTSEAAVLEMVDRLNRVHKLSAELQSQINHAVQHSQVLSQS